MIMTKCCPRCLLTIVDICGDSCLTSDYSDEKTGSKKIGINEIPYNGLPPLNGSVVYPSVDSRFDRQMFIATVV